MNYLSFLQVINKPSHLCRVLFVSQGGWGRGIKESAQGTLGREEVSRGTHLFSLPTVPCVLISIFTGIPSERL